MTHRPLAISAFGTQPSCLFFSYSLSFRGLQVTDRRGIQSACVSAEEPATEPVDRK